MKIRYPLILSLCSAIWCSAAVAEDNAPAPAETEAAPVATPGPDDVLLTVNGTDITPTTFQAYRSLRQRPEPRDPQQAQVLLLNEMTTLMIVAQDAAKRGLDKNDDAAPVLEMGRNLALVELAMRDFNSSYSASDEEIQAAYDTAHRETPPEYKASHILVKEEDKAKEIIGKLNDGGDFAELAKENSIDPGSGSKGGDLDWFAGNAMVKPFADAVASMEKGGISEAPVQTDFGWHVIYLEDTRTTEPPKLEDVRPQLENQLHQEALRAYIKELQDSAKIDVKALAADREEAPQTEATK